MFVMIEMEIGRNLFVTIYVYHKFEKYVHSEERKGGVLIYREHLLFMTSFHILSIVI